MGDRLTLEVTPEKVRCLVNGHLFFEDDEPGPASPWLALYAAPDRRDLGSFASDVSRVIEQVRATLPRGTTIDLRGQIQTMRSSFTRLGLGMIFAVVLVYLLMAVNFQSWLDPFIILMALPGALAGIVWMLFITQTTFSVPSMMGSIMCIGVATANSILVVVFANDQRVEGMDARSAALSVGSGAVTPGWNGPVQEAHVFWISRVGRVWYFEQGEVGRRTIRSMCPMSSKALMAVVCQ